MKKTTTTATKTAPATKPTTKPAEPKVSEKVLNCNTIKAALQLTDRVQFETAKTAKNAANSASVLYPDFFALTLVSEDGKASKRFLEYWGKKANKCEVLLTKQVFTQLSEAAPNLPVTDCQHLTTFFEIAVLHKSHKMIFKLTNDDAFLLIQAIIDNL